MKPFADLYDDVMPELPGVELSLVLHTIKRISTDFHSRSHFWRVELPAVDTLPGVAEYSFPDPADAVIECIVSVTYDGRHLDGYSPFYLNRLMGAWRDVTGSVTCYTQPSKRVVTLVRKPGSGIVGGLSATAALSPAEATGSFDDDVFSAFRRGLAAGVLAKLLRMKRKPWTDDIRGREYAREYDLEVAAASAMAARAYGSATLRTNTSP